MESLINIQFDPWPRLSRELADWMNTPYQLHSQSVGGGVDCVRFVTAIGDALLNRPRTEVPKEIDDVAMHDPKKAFSVMRWIMRQFDMRRVDPSDGVYEVEAADVVVVGPPGGGPGHAMIAGGDGYLWHCVQHVGVVRTGITFSGMKFFAVLRRKKGWPS